MKQEKSVRHSRAVVLALVGLLGISLAAPMGVPKFKQKSDNDCGPAALASALKYWQDKGYKVKGSGIEEMYENAEKKGKTDSSGTRSDNFDDATEEATGGTGLDGHWPASSGAYGSFNYLLDEFGKGQTVIILIKVTGPNGTYGHYMVVNDASAQPGFAPSCSLEVMNPATGEYERYKADSTAGGLQFPYDGGTATIYGVYCISPQAKVESEADTLADGKVKLTYTVFPGPPGDTASRVKDIHIVVPDSGKIEGVPPGWKPPRWSRERRGFRVDLYDSCQTSGAAAGTEISITLPGGKVKKVKCRVTLTNSGDSGNAPGAPDRIWHEWALVTVCADDPEEPTAVTCCCAMPDPAGVRLSWPTAADNVAVDGYTLDNRVTELPDTTTADTFFVLTDPEPDRLHRYAVMAFDSVGNHSTGSPAAGFFIDEWGGQETPAGVSVVNAFFCPQMWQEGERPFGLVFGQVLDSGGTVATYFTGSQVDPPVGPGEMRVLAPWYRFSTDAVTAGPLLVELPWSEVDLLAPAGPPAMFQLVGGAWLDITESVNHGERYVTGLSLHGLNTDGSGVFALAYPVLPGADVAAGRFIEPGSSVRPGRFVTPTVEVANLGPSPRSFPVVYELDGVVRDTQWVLDLFPGESTEVWFQCLAPASGAGHTLRAWTALGDDGAPGNDTARLEIAAPVESWVELESMPSAPSGRAVKRGGWLAGTGDGRVFAAKGNRTGDFYDYDPVADAWTVRRRVGDRTRGPNESDKGGKGVSDGSDNIYAVLGNNTTWFLRYHIPGDSWFDLERVPEGASRKAVKGGGDLVHVVKDDTGWVYFLKGYEREFYRYNTVAGRWDALPDAPAGVKPKYKRGSWLVYDGAHTIYCHKANYYDRGLPELRHEMYRFDVRGDTWLADSVRGMPLLGLHGGSVKKKKSKDGGTAAWFEDRIYALKGGNTQQFWCYDVASDAWTELDTVPTFGTTGRRKRVKHGADIISAGDGVFYALKGNKTRELWRYVLPAALPAKAGRGAPATAAAAGLRPVFGGLAAGAAGPGAVLLRYDLPGAGPATIGLYDVSGRARARRSLVLVGRSGTIRLETAGLGAGVYLARLETRHGRFLAKVVIGR